MPSLNGLLQFDHWEFSALKKVKSSVGVIPLSSSCGDLDLEILDKIYSV